MPPVSYSKDDVEKLLIKQQPCEINEGINNVACQPSKPEGCSVQWRHTV